MTLAGDRKGYEKSMNSNWWSAINPAFLLGTAFNIAYWHRKYHSGTICKGVSKEQTSNALSGCDKEEIPKLV